MIFYQIFICGMKKLFCSVYYYRIFIIYTRRDRKVYIFFYNLAWMSFQSIVLFNTNEILFPTILVQEWQNFFCDLWFTEVP
jgi:hypothetical protein